MVLKSLAFIYMKAINITREKEIAFNVTEATSFLKRMKGLLFMDSLARGEALLIKPCKGIHTFGMKFVIDVIFLDKDNNIIAMKKALRPNRFTPIYLRAVSALELPAGTIDNTSMSIGDRIKFID